MTPPTTDPQPTPDGDERRRGAEIARVDELVRAGATRVDGVDDRIVRRVAAVADALAGARR